ncbi:MAG TPA: acyl-CoA dehydrogenase [Candidatus Baltobacteraceae bacterium]
MDFKLSGEQTLIKDSVERFVAQQPAPAEPWREFAKLGWLGIGAPEDLGGFGGALETMLVMEAFGRGLYLEPYAACAVFPAAILRAAGRSDQLEGLIEGERRFAVAYEEPGAHYNPGAVSARSERSNGGYVLTGKKVRVPVPRGDATFLVSAKTDGDVTLFAVAPGSSGLQRHDEIAEDGTTVARLELDAVIVEESARIGDAPGVGLLQRGLEYANAALCGEAVGLMGTMFDLTLGYLKERNQFGVPIGSFQALQHRMAEMFTELELARSMAYVAAMTADDESDAEARARAIAGAKIQVSRSGRFVGQNAVQLHGAIAMTQEYKLGAYFKRMTSLERLFGDVDYHLDRYLS